MKPLKYEGMVIQIREHAEGCCYTQFNCDSATGCPTSTDVEGGGVGLLGDCDNRPIYLARLEERLNELESVIKTTGYGKKMTLESEEQQLEKAIKALQERHKEVADELKKLNEED